MADVTLELACGRCGEWWIRWTVDPDRPFDEQLLTSAAGEPYLPPEVRPGVMTTDSPGGYNPASDGDWYRRTPGEHASLPEGAIHARREFICPNGCRSDVQAGVHKLDAAAAKALRHLYETRTVIFRTTVDKLLRSAA
jgi:hypothetical protein